MPVPAKKADQYMDMLNDVLQTGNLLGDIDRFNITEHINRIMGTNPIDALLLKAFLAHIDGKFKDSSLAFETAISINESDPFVHTNYARMLCDHGLTSDAAKEVRKALECCKNANEWAPLGYLAASAFSIHDIELLEEISQIAEKLNIKDSVFKHAAITCNFEGASDEECVSLLESSISDEELRSFSVEITPERWANMTALADRLSKYVD